MTMALKKLNRKKQHPIIDKSLLTVEYDPILQIYYIPSKSRTGEIEKWSVWESKNKLDSKGNLKWFCNCEDYSLNKKYEGECRHVQIARFYDRHEYNKKYIIIRKS